MSYYNGVIEHDTGVHADAEQTVSGQQMLMLEITVSEYRTIIKENAEAKYKLAEKDKEIMEYKQKLYEALKILDEDNKLTVQQKDDYRVLCGDWSVKK